MNKTEVLNIVNEPSKHIQIVKIDGKDSIVYSSKFVELLELIPNMLTKADMMAMIEELKKEIKELKSYESADGQDLVILADIGILLQEKINVLKAESEDKK